MRLKAFAVARQGHKCADSPGAQARLGKLCIQQRLEARQELRIALGQQLIDRFAVLQKLVGHHQQIARAIQRPDHALENGSVVDLIRLAFRHRQQRRGHFFLLFAGRDQQGDDNTNAHKG